MDVLIKYLAAAIVIETDARVRDHHYFIGQW